MYINLWLFYLHVSWFVQLYSRFDLTTGLALKNYPNLNFYIFKSMLCISIYGYFTFMSADLYSCTADLNSPLTQGLALKNYSNLTFSMLKSLVSISTSGDFTFKSADLYSWTAELTTPSDLSWKSNHSWCLTCCNLTCTGNKIYQIIPNPSKPNQIHSKVIVVSQLLIWTTFTLDILLILGLISEFYQTKPYQTKPNNL